MITYRRAVDTDEGAIRNMDEVASREIPANPFFGYKDCIGTLVPLSSFFVAYDGDRAVGMLGAMAMDGDNWYVSHFFVREEARGRGVGRGLMEAAGAWHESQGRKTALATPLPSAEETYKRLGFKEIAKTMEWSRS